MSARKLDSGELHFLRLIDRDGDAEGWTPVSKTLMPLVLKMPGELVESEAVGDQGRGRARLKPQGQGILDALAWLGPQQ